MNSKERVIGALEHKPLDRVPMFEWLVDKKVVDKFIPGGTFEEFSVKYTDAVMVELDYTKEVLSETRTRNEWGIINEDTGEAHAFPVDGPIHSMKDLDKYEPPRADAPGRYDSIERAIEKYGDDKAVFLHLNDIWSLPSRMMPFDDFIMTIIDDPVLIEGLVKMTVDAQIELAKGAAKRGIKFVYTGDDIAYNSGPMISPAMFEDMFVPELNRIVKAYKDLGFYVVKHTDGNIMPVIDMLLGAGFDCIDPIDPIAGMDLAHIKKTYGDNVAIKGNVNCATTLVSGTVEETIAETKSCLEIGMPGSGYIISSSNTIHASVNPENYKAMLETIKEFGNY